MRRFSDDFPILSQDNNGKRLVYLDNGATTQKPREVIKAITEYYDSFNANPHRGAYELSIKATDIYENARSKTQKFINAKYSHEIIFTKNATESLNLVAYSYGLSHVGAGDEVLIAISEHHSNLVPWQYVCQMKGATLKYIYLEEDHNLSQRDIEEKITDKGFKSCRIHVISMVCVLGYGMRI